MLPNNAYTTHLSTLKRHHSTASTYKHTHIPWQDTLKLSGIPAKLHFNRLNVKNAFPLLCLFRTHVVQLMAICKFHHHTIRGIQISPTELELNWSGQYIGNIFSQYSACSFLSLDLPLDFYCAQCGEWVALMPHCRASCGDIISPWLLLKREK